MTSDEERVAKARAQLKTGDVGYEDIQQMLKLAFIAGFTAGKIVGEGESSFDDEQAWQSFQEFSHVIYHAMKAAQEQCPNGSPDL